MDQLERIYHAWFPHFQVAIPKWHSLFPVSSNLRECFYLQYLSIVFILFHFVYEEFQKMKEFDIKSSFFLLKIDRVFYFDHIKIYLCKD